MKGGRKSSCNVIEATKPRQWKRAQESEKGLEKNEHIHLRSRREWRTQNDWPAGSNIVPAHGILVLSLCLVRSKFLKDRLMAKE